MALHGGGQPVDRISGLFEQRADIGARRIALACADRGGRRQARDGGQPFLDLVIEAVLSAAGLQFQKADDERARQTEKRGGEGRAHALDRIFDGRHQAGRLHLARAGRRGGYGADRLADIGDDQQQAVEGAEQAEKDQQASEIAREGAAFGHARGHRIQHHAGRGRRQAGLAVCRISDQGRHRRDQRWRIAQLVGVGAIAQSDQPARAGADSEGLLEGVENADQQHAQDHAINGGIGLKGGDQRFVQRRRQRQHDAQKHRHPDDVLAGAGKAHLARLGGFGR